MRGLLTETAHLLERGELDPDSPAGRAIGYRQAIDFLTTEARWVAGGGANDLNDVSKPEALAAQEARFLVFFHLFATKTRHYAAHQMKWFRSPKGHCVSWKEWNLGGPIENNKLYCTGKKKGPKNKSPNDACKKTGDGVSSMDVVGFIEHDVGLSREVFDKELDSEHQAKLRSDNFKRASDMKFYIPVATSIIDHQTFNSLVKETTELAKRLHRAGIGAEAAVATKV